MGWETKGRWTHQMIPNIAEWVERGHGEVNYYLTQALSGHGCFNKYLYDFKIKNSPRCDHCQAEVDDTMHTLFQCNAWTTDRENTIRELGETITPTNLVKMMLSSKEKWNVVVTMVTNILKKKENIRN